MCEGHIDLIDYRKGIYDMNEANIGYVENLPGEVVLNEVKLEDIEVTPVKAKNGKKAKLTNQLKTTKEEKVTASTSTGNTCYILNTNTKKFHVPSCSSADDIKPTNKKEVDWSRDKIIEEGYSPCKRCNP